jgi:hypothetical protein
MDPTTYVALKSDIKTMVEYFNTLHKDLDYSGSAIQFQILFIANFQRGQDDSHPNFQRGMTRVLPYIGRDPSWLYKEGLNDDHIKTALKKIFKELGYVK